MQNLKIRVNSADESKEAQKLFFKLGGSWAGYKETRDWPEIKQLYLGENYITFSSDINFFAKDSSKEITLPELRAMVNPMKEYLDANRNYEFVLSTEKDDGFIEIPEGAIRARFYPHDPDGLEFENSILQWWHDENNEWINYENYSNTLEHSRVVWQREQDEPFLTPETTLNDQYAEIEQVRQVEMKEYLIPSANYKYQKAYPITSWREWIEIPEGAEWAKLWDKGESYECVEFYRGENEFFSNSSKKWMRGADESTNKIGQPATIIWNRHASNSAATLHGTVKTEPDLNFGAAQASGGVDATLAERQSTYGNFEDVAFVTENIMSILAQVRVNGLNDLPNTHRMALYMIASKMARIVNGDFNHLDSWHDIGGYSKLIEKLIKGE